MVELYVRLANLLRDEKGQGLVEYALIMLLASVVSVAALTALEGQLTTMLTAASGMFPGT